MGEESSAVSAESGSGFKNVDKLPLGKLLRIKYPRNIERKKKQSLTGKLKLKGPPHKDKKK